MSVAVLLAYAVGVAAGLAAARIPALARHWPSLIRAQLLAGAVALSITAVWRLQGIDELLWPAMMAGTYALMLLFSWLVTRGPRRAGVAALRTWAATPNTAFFVTPVAAALAGPSGVVVAVVMDRLSTPVWGAYIAMMRRDAPIRQRRRTSLVDQSPLLAVLVGVALRYAAAPPDWTATAAMWLAPFMAALGAAMYVGSVLHPSQRIDPRPGIRSWLGLVAVRVLPLAVLALTAPTPALALVAVLCALSIPAFGPPQMSTVYGYAEPAVAAANRYGWIVGALGLLTAVALTTIA